MTFDLEAYNYELPPEALATEPAEPRDSARLLVYDTKADTLTIDTFQNLASYIPADSFLVFNNTKVLPARVVLHKALDEHQRGGGKVEILFLVNEWLATEVEIKGLSDRKLIVGQKLFFPNGESVTVVNQDEKVFYFKPNIDREQFMKLLETVGTMPLPKYLRETTLTEAELKTEYQSIFADKPASVAAPTASLHFTPMVMDSLAERGIARHFVTLHVGLGTFAPIDEMNFQTKKLFTEYYEVAQPEAEAIATLKQTGQKLIAVGTTATRALESSGGQAGIGKTDIFIYPSYQFKMIDGLITNFHLPKSSLMLLVEALLQHKGAKRHIVELYQYALEHHFRFYSFGDGMLIL